MSSADVRSCSLTPDSVRQRDKAEFPANGRSPRPAIDRGCVKTHKAQVPKPPSQIALYAFFMSWLMVRRPLNFLLGGVLHSLDPLRLRSSIFWTCAGFAASCQSSGWQSRSLTAACCSTPYRRYKVGGANTVVLRGQPIAALGPHPRLRKHTSDACSVVFFATAYVSRQENIKTFPINLN